MIEFEDFERVDVRVGRILEVEKTSDAKSSTHILKIDFGPLGTKKSCARVVRYSDEELVGQLVLGVINLEPRQIGPHMSEVLTLGVPDEEGEAILLVPEREVPLGGKIY